MTFTHPSIAFLFLRWSTIATPCSRIEQGTRQNLVREGKFSDESWNEKSPTVYTCDNCYKIKLGTQDVNAKNAKQTTVKM